jgi:hypothetical protein
MGVKLPPPESKPSRIGRVASVLPTTLGVIASLIAIGGLGLAAREALTGGSGRASAGVEAKQIVGFRQVTDRICAENQAALVRALSEAHSGVQLLSFLSRGTGWGINDLEGVTAPESLVPPFLDEIDARRRVQEALLNVQRAGEIGDRAARAEAVSEVDVEERAIRETGRELGLRRCAPVLPSHVRRAIDVG